MPLSGLVFDLLGILFSTLQITTAYLKEDDIVGYQRTTTFSSLHWGRQYCVSMKVEGNGARRPSAVSPKQCLLLPERGETETTVMTHNNRQRH